MKVHYDAGGQPYYEVDGVHYATKGEAFRAEREFLQKRRYVSKRPEPREINPYDGTIGPVTKATIPPPPPRPKTPTPVPLQTVLNEVQHQRDDLRAEVDDLREAITEALEVNQQTIKALVDFNRRKELDDERIAGLAEQVSAWQEDSEEKNKEILKLNGYLKEVYDWTNNAKSITDLRNIMERWARGDLD